MKKLLCAFFLVIAIGFAYGQEVKDAPSSIATISGDVIERPPSGSFSDILRSIQPTASIGPSWATGNYSGNDWAYKFSPRVEIVVGGYRDFIFSDEFNRKWKTRAGLRLRFGRTSENWKEVAVDYEESYKINWGYIEVPVEIAYKFEVFGKKAFGGIGLSPGIKLYANWKDEEGYKDKLEDIKGGNLFISPLVGIQLCDHSELGVSYDFGIVAWGESDYYKKHHINSIRVAYVHKFY